MRLALHVGNSSLVTMNYSLFSSTPLADFLAVVSAALNSDSPRHWRFLCAPRLLPCSEISLCNTPALRLARAAPADGAQGARRRNPAMAMLRASSPMPCDLDRSIAGGGSLFTPYLPLAALYDRGLAAPSSYSFTSSSPPSPPAFESPCASASASASDSSHAPPSPPRSDSAGSDPDLSANDAVRVVHHSCDALPLSASYSPPRLLPRGGAGGGTPTPIPSMRRTGQGKRFHETNEGDVQVDDRVFVCRRSRTMSRIGRWRSRLFRLPPSQTSFDPPRASIPPSLAGPSSSARTFSLAHTDNAFPPPSSCAPPRAPSPPRLRPRPAVVSPGVRDGRS
ncbi:hypothetical protein B0H14DRAFT_3712085 [Mycena olivaceomarginata]|nr:hypothetical protein B0H14DRAFT_3712085 [Mycena olivaceomarginata]